jgi:hypothetical protein
VLEDRLFASSRDMMTMDAAIDLRIGLQLSPARDLRVRQPRLGGHQDCYGECGGYARGPPSAFSGRMWVSPLGATPRGVPVPGCARAREASALRGRRDVASAGLCGEVCVSYAKICDPWHPAPLLCSPGSLAYHIVCPRAVCGAGGGCSEVEQPSVDFGSKC